MCIISIVASCLFNLYIFQNRKFLHSNLNFFETTVILFFNYIVYTVTFTIATLVFISAFWIILTWVFYLLSLVFKSDGSFKRMLEFVGYGFVPQIFNAIVFFLLNPQSHVLQLFGIICLLWSAYIWIFALSCARNMSIKNAIFTVGFPVGLQLVIDIYYLFGGH